MHLRVYLLLHVVVLVADYALHSTCTVFLVHLLGSKLHEALAVFEAAVVVVANDIRELGLFDVRRDIQQMVETLITLCGLRGLAGWQHAGKLCRQRVGIDHLSLGIARVYADALDGDLGRGGVEVLELQLTHVAAIHRIGPLASELLDVEVARTHAYLLVGIEGNAYLAVFHILVLFQPRHRLHDFRYACFVVGAQQRRAVCDDQVFTHVLQEFRKFLRTADDAFRQQDV